MDKRQKIGLILMIIGTISLLIYTIGTIHNHFVIEEYERQAKIYMNSTSCELEDLILCEIQNKTIYKFDCIKEEINYICGKIKANKKEWKIKIN